MSPRRKKPPEDDSGRWMTTYGDVVTLLLAFFVLLYAISQVDQRKFQLFVSGLEVPFGNQAASLGGVLSGNTGLADDTQGPLPAMTALTDNNIGLGLIDGGEDPSEATSPTTTTTSTTTTTTQPLPPDDVLTTAEELAALRDRIWSELEEAGLDQYIDLEIDHRGLVAAVATDDVLFPSGSTEISEDGRAIIDVLGPSLAAIGNPIQIEGHTDDVPLVGRPGYDNWNLSTDRAVRVLHLLTDEHGIDPVRLVAMGYGEYRPRDDNETVDGRSRNRRIEVVIVAETE